MLYFIRHAATDGNLRNVWVGHDDQPITPVSQIELMQTAVILSQINFSRIYTSPLRRAISTAKAIKQYQKSQPELLIEPALIERDFAEFEGCNKSAENRLLMEMSAAVESVEEIKNRLLPFIQPLFYSAENILLVSHSGIFRCLRKIGLSSHHSKSNLKNLEWVILTKD